MFVFGTEYPMIKQKYLIHCLLFISVCFILNCSAKGPPFPNIPDTQAMPLEGRYRFSLKSHFFWKNLRGEIYLEKGNSKIEKTYFTMRTLGQNKKGAIRMHSYEGRAYQLKTGNLELRAERCYRFGKQDWEDRLVLLLGWDCDHLFFTYKSPSNFQKWDVLKPLHTERTKYSDWFPITPPRPIPLGVISTKRKTFFAGQIISLDETPKTKILIVWGTLGARLLRDGQVLTAQDDSGKTVGKMKVLSRPGDFIICRWIGSIPAKATIAYVNKAAYVKED